jgi:hypothetical protein
MEVLPPVLGLAAVEPLLVLGGLAAVEPLLVLGGCAVGRCSARRAVLRRCRLASP